jgi:hypothetical protein
MKLELGSIAADSTWGAAVYSTRRFSLKTTWQKPRPRNKIAAGMEPKRSCIRRLGEAAGKKPKSSWRLLLLPRMPRRVEAAGNGT